MLVYDAKVRERFWAKVDRNGPTPEHAPHLGPCWIWTRSGNQWGYGQFEVNSGGHRKNELTHRVAWRLTNGPIPDGACVLHRCDNPPCCNPAHLFLGTHKDNNDDKIAKGRARYPAGEENGKTKLTAADVERVAEMWASGKHTRRSIAEAFGISCHYVGQMVRGTRRQLAPAIKVRVRGARHGMAKLTADDVRWARWARTYAGVTHQSIATALGVERTTIGGILRGDSWAA